MENWKAIERRGLWASLKLARGKEGKGRENGKGEDGKEKIENGKEVI